MVLSVKKIGDGVRGDKKDNGDNVPIEIMHSVNASHSWKPHSPTPVFIKECSTFPKLLEMRGKWGGGGGGEGEWLKIFARKREGGVRQIGVGVCLEMGGCHIILRLFLEIPHDAA